MFNTRALVDKLWSYCNVLRDDGVGTIEYTGQLTYLLFLKMAHERATRKLNPQQIVPPEYSWQTLLDAKGDALETQYRHILEELGKRPGVLGTIFRKAQNRIQDPAKLKRLIVDLIDKENWSATGTDIKGDAYESLLSKGAEDIKSGAGQYFTPRAVIQAMVDCVQPTVKDRVVDPAAGTGGFLLAAHEYASRGSESMTRAEKNHLQHDFVYGYELVDGTARLAAMNLILHGIGNPAGDSLIEVRDALIADPGDRWSVVLSNPPFGRKSSLMMVGADGAEVREDREIERQDFMVTTSNKQLNFLQHIFTILDINGRAAVVLPDNVLFEGGAGETLRRKLLRDFDLHTMLCLPTGIFYAQGVKANVLFFDKKPAAEHPWTERLWVYDLRTNQHFTLKQNPLRRQHLNDFVDCYAPGKPHSERTESTRFKSFTYDELIARDKVNLDITWIRDDSLEDTDNLPAPHLIAREIIEDLTAALVELEAVAVALERSLGRCKIDPWRTRRPGRNAIRTHMGAGALVGAFTQLSAARWLPSTYSRASAAGVEQKMCQLVHNTRFNRARAKRLLVVRSLSRSRWVSGRPGRPRPSTGRHTSKNDHLQRPATTTNHQFKWGATAKTQVNVAAAHTYDV